MALITPKAKPSFQRAIIDHFESQVVQEFTSQSHRKEIVTTKKSSSRHSFDLKKFPTFQSFNLDAVDDSSAVHGAEEDDIEDEASLPEANIIPYSPRADVEVNYIVKENERIAKIVKEQVHSAPPPLPLRVSLMP
jgi:hypothetical protein